MTFATPLVDTVRPEAIASFALVFDLSASLVWAVSGALLAARRGYDVAGIFAIALVSSTGGGLVRDGLFLQNGPPLLVRSNAYIVIAALAACVVWSFGSRLHDLRLVARIITITDSLGLGAFAVVGMGLATKAGLSVPGVMLVGVVNAVGGSIFRSILLREVPELFRPGAFVALASFMGCLAFVLLTRVLGVSQLVASTLTIALVAAVRVASVRYRLHSLPARGFGEPEGPKSSPSSRI